MSAISRTEWWRPSAKLDGADQSGSLPAPKYETLDSALPFWALMAFTFILVVAPQSFLPALAPFRIALLAAAVAVAGHLFHRFVHGRPLMRLTREMWIAAVLVGWAILMVPLSYWAGGSVSLLLEMYFKSLVVFWLIANVVNTVPRLRQIFWGLSLMAIPLAVTAVANFLSGAYMHAGSSTDGVRRIVGYNAPLTENPNDLALMLNLILPLCVALVFVNRNSVVRTILLSIIGLIIIAIVSTFSRTGFLTLAITGTAYMWALFRRNQGKPVFLVIVLLLAAVPFVPPSYIDRLSTITNIESDTTGSAQERWADTVAATKYVVRHPIIGAGIGNDALAMNKMRGPTWKEIHNVYFQYAVELGIPGLIMFILLLRACIKSARWVQDQSAHGSQFEETFYLAEGIRIALIAFCVAAFFQPSGYNFYFYYMAGLALAARECIRPEKADASPTPGAVPGLSG